MEQTIVVSPTGHEDLIHVKWQFPLGLGQQGTYVRSEILQMHGVEEVVVQKYSAAIRGAPHVTSLDALFPALKEYL